MISIWQKLKKVGKRGLNRRKLLGKCAVTLVFLMAVSLLGLEAFAQEKEPIVIGCSIAQTGGLARTARAELRAVTLAGEQVNQKGGVLGRPIKLIIYDDQSKEDVAVKLYRKLIYQDKVNFLVGPMGSGLQAAITPLIEDAKIPCVAPQAADPRIWEVDRDWTVQILPSMAEYWREGIDLAVDELGVKTFAFAYLDSAMQVAGTQEAKKQIEKKYPDVKIVLEERFPIGLESYTPLLAKVKATKADALFGGGYVPQSMEVVKAAKSVGYYPKVINVFFACDPLFGGQLGEVAEGVTAPSPWEIALPTPGNEEFVKAYRERWKEQPYHDMAASYAAFMLLIDGIREAGSLDKEAVRDYLFNIKTTTVFGKYKVNSFGAQIGKEMLTIQWQEGKKEIVMPKELRTAGPISLWGGK